MLMVQIKRNRQSYCDKNTKTGTTQNSHITFEPVIYLIDTKSIFFSKLTGVKLCQASSYNIR